MQRFLVDDVQWFVARLRSDPVATCILVKFTRPNTTANNSLSTSAYLVSASNRALLVYATDWPFWINTALNPVSADMMIPDPKKDENFDP